VNLIRYRPAPPLDRYVECFWWSRRDAPQDHSEHMLPSGRAQLLFALHETPILCGPPTAGNSIAWTGSIVHGPQSSYYVAGPKPAGVCVGVSFRAGAAGAVLGVSLRDLTDRHVAITDIWGRRGITLRDELMSATDPTEIFRILERSLSARIHRPLLIHPAVAHALSSQGLIADAQRSSGYSPRHFIALFHAAVGLNPKYYYRLRRFNAAAAMMATRDGQSLSDIAAAAGYSDQAHLTRDFSDFAGVAPTRYRPGGSDRPLHHRMAVERGRADR